MNNLFNNELLNSIVWIKQFYLDMYSLKMTVLCVQNGIDVYYDITIKDVVACIFRQEDPSEDFNVIDAFLEPFNECIYLDFMHSPSKSEYWVLRFHSGLHHLVVGFKTADLVHL